MNLGEKYPEWEQAIRARSGEAGWSAELLEAVRKVAAVMLDCDDAFVSFEQALVEIHSMRGDREEVRLSSRSGRTAVNRGGANWSMSVTDVRHLADVNDLARLTDEEIGEALRVRREVMDDHMADHFYGEASSVVDYALSLKAPALTSAQGVEQL